MKTPRPSTQRGPCSTLVLGSITSNYVCILWMFPRMHLHRYLVNAEYVEPYLWIMTTVLVYNDRNAPIRGTVLTCVPRINAQDHQKLLRHPVSLSELWLRSKTWVSFKSQCFHHTYCTAVLNFSAFWAAPLCWHSRRCDCGGNPHLSKQNIGWNT